MHTLPSKEYREKQYLELVPILLLAVNTIMYAYYIASEHWGLLYSFTPIYNLSKQIFEGSLITLFVLKLLSKNWQPFSKNCLKILFILWALNFIYIIFELTVDVYYVCIAAIFYAIFVFLIIRYIVLKR